MHAGTHTPMPLSSPSGLAIRRETLDDRADKYSGLHPENQLAKFALRGSSRARRIRGRQRELSKSEKQRTTPALSHALGIHGTRPTLDRIGTLAKDNDPHSQADESFA
jgi:hypothetical protein